MKTKILSVYEPNKIEIRETEIPEPSEDEVIIKTVFSAISPGTELRCMSGNGEATSFPYVPGYATSGIIIKSGNSVKIRKGTKVFTTGTKKCGIRTQWGGHSQYVLQSENNVIELPEKFDLLDAVIAKLASISYHGVRFSQPRKGTKVIVAGLGPIGQLSARIHHALGANVGGGDINEARVDLLRKQGIKAVNTSSKIEDAFRKFFPDGADIIIDATGNNSIIPSLISIAKDLSWNNNDNQEGAKYLVQGSYSECFTIPYSLAFMKEISFYIPRDTQKSDYLSVIELVLNGKIILHDIVSEIISPEKAQYAYDKLKKNKDVAGTMVFKWD